MSGAIVRPAPVWSDWTLQPDGSWQSENLACTWPYDEEWRAGARERRLADTAVRDTRPSWGVR